MPKTKIMSSNSYENDFDFNFYFLRDLKCIYAIIKILNKLFMMDFRTLSDRKDMYRPQF